MLITANFILIYHGKTSEDRTIHIFILPNNVYIDPPLKKIV